MAFPNSINSTAALVQFLYQHTSWPKSGASQIYVYGLQLPAGWTLRRGVLVLPDGGPTGSFTVELNERFSMWCYGTTPLESSLVADTLMDVLDRPSVHSFTVSGKTCFLSTAERVMGPSFQVEPVTEWPRTVVAYQVTMVRYAEA